MRADRGVDGELVRRGYLIIQRFDDSDGASGSVDSEEGRRRLEGEENAASGPLVWICCIYHKNGCSHSCVLKTTFKQTG